MKTQSYDVAIIGGGIAGLYSGMRLKRSALYREKSIAVFEATSRLGGRIKSYYHSDLGNSCELGCMRYLKSQRMMTNLIEKHYQLDIQPFSTGNVDKHFYYLRGQHVDPIKWQAPYNLPREFHGQSPFRILDHIIDMIKSHNNIPAGTTVSAEEWAQIKKTIVYPFQGTLFGKKLQDIGFANLISEFTSYETLKFLCDSGEYYAKTINWNASEAFPYSQSIGYKAKDDIEYWCAKNGFSELIEHMSQEFQTLSGSVYENHVLKVIKKHDNKKKQYHLTFSNNKTGETHEIIANHVIFSVPKKPLNDIVWLNELGEQFYSTEFQYLLNSIRILPTIRFALLFKNAWWQKDFDGLNGHMVTDLPLRHGYYFGSTQPDRYSVFLSTVDMDVTDYWLSHIGNHNETGTLSKSALDEIIKQLTIIHKNKNIEQPIAAQFYNWCSRFYGGGFHSWNPNYSVSDVMKAMRKPFQNETIYIIGEGFSGLQGWAEGALCTAEKLMNEHFHLTLNESWLEKDYFYGY